MGAKNKEQRELFFSDLDLFGIELDNGRNNNTFNVEAVISSESSRIPIYVIPTNEELEIANQCKKILYKRKKNG